MKRNGFTLIELLAVIIILAIIALIATPIILGIINDAREKANERSVELYASAVRNAVAAYQLTNSNVPETFSDLNVEYDGDVECAKEELYSNGSFYLEGCKVNGSEKEYSYGVDLTPTVCSIEKQDASKYSIGDIVTCNIGETPDKFYVIEDAELSATSIQMLTEKNIHTIEHRQSDSASAVAFSGKVYWSSTVSSYPAYVYNNNSLLYPIVENYISYLNTKLTGVTGNLLTYNQAENLGCSGSSCSSAQSWVYSTSYWTGFTYVAESLGFVDSDGYYCNAGSGNYMIGIAYGVRPVITISTSEIQ